MSKTTTSRVTRIGLLFSVLAFASVSFSSTPSSAQSEPPYVIIVEILSQTPTSGSSGDDVYVSLSNRERLPQSGSRKMYRGQNWAPRYVSGMGNGLVISVMEADTVGSDDLIGKIKIDASTAPGRHTKILTGDSSRYMVVYDVLPSSTQIEKSIKESDAKKRKFSATTKKMIDAARAPRIKSTGNACIDACNAERVKFLGSSSDRDCYALKPKHLQKKGQGLEGICATYYGQIADRKLNACTKKCKPVRRVH